MRERGRVVRQWREKWKGWLPAGAGCLILLLAGCAPAVMLTKNYIDNREEADNPSQAYPVSSVQVPPDQTPLLTTKDFKGTTEEVRESSQVNRATLDQVWIAALKALGDLRASVTTSNRSSVGGEIEGRWVGGQPLAMYLDQMGAGTIRVKIRVGQFGDQEAESTIQARIGKNL